MIKCPHRQPAPDADGASHDFRVLTYISAELVAAGQHEVLLQTADNFGYQIDALGMKKPWSGLYQKITDFMTHVQQHPQNQWWLVCDGNDVFFVGPPSELRIQVLRHGSGVSEHWSPCGSVWLHVAVCSSVCHMLGSVRLCVALYAALCVALCGCV